MRLPSSSEEIVNHQYFSNFTRTKEESHDRHQSGSSKRKTRTTSNTRDDICQTWTARHRWKSILDQGTSVEAVMDEAMSSPDENESYPTASHTRDTLSPSMRGKPTTTTTIPQFALPTIELEQHSYQESSISGSPTTTIRISPLPSVKRASPFKSYHQSSPSSSTQFFSCKGSFESQSLQQQQFGTPSHNSNKWINNEESSEATPSCEHLCLTLFTTKFEPDPVVVTSNNVAAAQLHFEQNKLIESLNLIKTRPAEMHKHHHSNSMTTNDDSKKSKKAILSRRTEELLVSSSHGGHSQIFPSNKIIPRLDIRLHRKRSEGFDRSPRKIEGQNPYERIRGFEWNEKAAYTIALAGSIIGASNLATFPYLIYFYNGLGFVCAYIIVSLFITLPILSLEAAMCQTVQGGFVRTVDAINPRGRGLSIILFLIGFVAASSESTHAADYVGYLINSFTNKFPWVPTSEMLKNCNANPSSGCNTGGNDFCIYNNRTNACTIDQIEFAMDYYLTLCPALYSSAVNLGSITLIWIFLYIILSRGMGILPTLSLWKISVVVVVLLFLFSFGYSLPGASYALNILFEGKVHAFFDPTMWSFAMSQSIASGYSAAFGSLASKNKPDTPVIGCVYTAFFIDFIVSCLATLAVFPYLGYIRDQFALSILAIAKDDSYITFSVFPLALSLLPGAPVFCFLFFFTCMIISLGTAAAQLMGLLDELCALKSTQDIPKMLIGLVLVSGGVCLSIGTSQAEKTWKTNTFTIRQVGLLLTTLLFVLLAGWGDVYANINSHIGSASEYLHAFSYFMILIGTTIIMQCDVCPISKMSQFLTLLTFSLLLFIGSLSLASKWRRTHRRQESLESNIKVSFWWLWVGSIEEMRADLNDIIIGPLPLNHHKLYSNQFAYGRGHCGCLGRKKFPRWWSIVIKYIAPIILMLTINSKFLHIRGKGARDIDYDLNPYHILFISDESKYQLSNYLVFVSVTFCICIVGFIAPGAFRFLVLEIKLIHQRKWRGKYEPPLLEQMKRFFNCFDEIRTRRDWTAPEAAQLSAAWFTEPPSPQQSKSQIVQIKTEHDGRRSSSNYSFFDQLKRKRKRRMLFHVQIVPLERSMFRSKFRTSRLSSIHS